MVTLKLSTQPRQEVALTRGLSKRLGCLPSRCVMGRWIVTKSEVDRVWMSTEFSNIFPL